MLRLPSLAQPAGGDQNLYTYVGQRILAGGVPYLDAWEQKPPGIFFIYAFFWRLWPAESMVAAADLVAAGLVAWLLIALGRQWFTNAAGYGAAAIFLALGDPGLQRLSGLMVRAQCETFIALAVTMALVLTTRPERRPWHLPARRRVARGGGLAEVQRDRLRTADCHGGDGLAAANLAHWRRGFQTKPR